MGFLRLHSQLSAPEHWVGTVKRMVDEETCSTGKTSPWHRSVADAESHKGSFSSKVSIGSVRG